MNSDTLQILLRTVLKMIGGWLIAKGLANDSAVQDLTGGALALAGIIWALVHHNQALNSAAQSVPIKLSSSTGTSSSGPGPYLLLLLLSGCLVTGCTSQAIKAGDIVAIKERTFGITVSESPASGTPQIRLGFNSLVVQFIPTCTNGTIAAPNYGDTFDLHQGLNPFGTGISENTGAGNVMTGTNGETSAIVPK